MYSLLQPPSFLLFLAKFLAVFSCTSPLYYSVIRRNAFWYVINYSYQKYLKREIVTRPALFRLYTTCETYSILFIFIFRVIMYF